MSVKQPHWICETRKRLLIVISLLALIIFNFLTGSVHANDPDEAYIEYDSANYIESSSIEVEDITGKFDPGMLTGLKESLQVEKTPLINDTNTFRVVNAESDGTWVTASLVLLNINEDESFHDYNFDLLFIGKKIDATWKFVKIGTVDFQNFLSEISEHVMPREAIEFYSRTRQGNYTTAEQIDYKFPWPMGESRLWGTRNGNGVWHGRNTNAIDLFTHDISKRSAVASADGTVMKICMSENTADVLISHTGDEQLFYMHLQKDKLDSEIKLNASVKRGQKIGDLKMGTFFEPSNCNYKPHAEQGSNQGHLHLAILSKKITFEGWSFNSSRTYATKGTQTKNAGDWFLSTESGGDFPKYFPGDYNGDGLEDILEFVGNGEVKVALNTGMHYTAYEVWHTNTGKGSENPMVGDFNGDGKTDIINFLGDPGSGDVIVNLSDGDKFKNDINNKWHNWFGMADQRQLVGDVDGDGDDDIVNILPTGDVMVALADWLSFEVYQQRVWVGGINPSAHRVYLENVNNDNKEDLVIFEGNGIAKVAIADPNNQPNNIGGKFLSATVWNSNIGKSLENAQMADINGDKKKDVLNFLGDGTVMLSLSNSEEFKLDQKVIEVKTGKGNENPIIGDINADGMDDIVNITPIGIVYISESKEVDYLTNDEWKFGYNFTDSLKKVSLGDVNNDKLDDIIRFIANGEVHVAINIGNGNYKRYKKWHEWFFQEGQNPQVGYFDNDRKIDIINFVGDGKVYVSLSNGNAFGVREQWYDWFGMADQMPRVGDVNGDKLDDIVNFTGHGPVDVKRNNGSKQFVNIGSGWWNTWFGLTGQNPQMADIDYDGDDDAVNFLGNGYVAVAKSNRNSSFTGEGNWWHTNIGRTNEKPFLGRVGPDYKEDILNLTPDGNANASYSSGTYFTPELYKKNNSLLKWEKSTYIGDMFRKDGLIDILMTDTNGRIFSYENLAGQVYSNPIRNQWY